jgi:hypothetical protein
MSKTMTDTDTADYAFTETYQDYFERLKASGSHYMTRRRMKIMRSAAIKRLNAGRELSPAELRGMMGDSNCPFWLAEASTEDILAELKVGIIGRDITAKA